MADSFCSIDNPRIALSAFTWEQNNLTIRVYNPYSEAETFRLHLQFSISGVLRISLGGEVHKNILPENKGHFFSDTVKGGTIATYQITLQKEKPD